MEGELSAKLNGSYIGLNGGVSGGGLKAGSKLDSKEGGSGGELELIEGGFDGGGGEGVSVAHLKSYLSSS